MTAFNSWEGWDERLIGTEVIDCTTDQWNFPHDRNMPWASEGKCSICGADVETVRVGPDGPHTYSHISQPHKRTINWYRINSDELDAYIDYVNRW